MYLVYLSDQILDANILFTVRSMYRKRINIRCTLHKYNLTIESKAKQGALMLANIGQSPYEMS